MEKFNVERTLLRPAVLPGGSSLVPAPARSDVTWSASRWGTAVSISPRPRADEPTYPTAPILTPNSVERAKLLLEIALTKDAQLGYLGPNVRALEDRVADMVGGGAKVFAVANGSIALVIAYVALAIERFVVEHKPIPKVPNAVTTGWSFEATWTGLPKAGLKPVLVDVDPDTGCPTAEALEAAIDDDTAFGVVTLMYEQGPDLATVGELFRRRGLGLIIDAAHAPLATWRSRHVIHAPGVRIVTGSTQGSKVITDGSEGGFVIVCDPWLAALVAKIRNVARSLEPRPDWWPNRVAEVSGENARMGELTAILLDGALDAYIGFAQARRDALVGLREGLARHPELPWRMPPAQPAYGHVFYKGILVFDPARAAKRNAWERVGHGASGRMLASELLTEVARGYPGPWDPASGYNPGARPWQWADLLPDNLDPAHYPNTARLAETVQLVPHEFLARGRRAAEQCLAAMCKLDRWVDDSEVQGWALEFNAG